MPGEEKKIVMPAGYIPPHLRQPRFFSRGKWGADKGKLTTQDEVTRTSETAEEQEELMQDDYESDESSSRQNSSHELQEKGGGQKAPVERLRHKGKSVGKFISPSHQRKKQKKHRTLIE